MNFFGKTISAYFDCPLHFSLQVAKCSTLSKSDSKYFDAFIMVLCEYVQIAISTPIPITNSVKSLVYRRMCVNQNSHFIKLFMEISHFLQ